MGDLKYHNSHFKNKTENDYKASQGLRVFASFNVIIPHHRTEKGVGKILNFRVSVRSYYFWGRRKDTLIGGKKSMACSVTSTVLYVLLPFRTFSYC